MSDTKIAFLSGKGGTGKTFLAVNLAYVASPALYIDCDVEEPNGHLFLKPNWDSIRNVTVPLPQGDSVRCNGCRKCIDFCSYHALAWVNGRFLVFEELCHGCGGCLMVCPTQALSETQRTIGERRAGISGSIRVLSGFMNPGEASGVPVIKSLLHFNSMGTAVFIDCPPGSSCMASESIRYADYCVLVAEPTQFGAHNLNMVYELVRLYKKPCGAVLNKCLPGNDPSEDFCLEHGISILAKVPFEERLGLVNSNAQIAVREDERYRTLFMELLLRIETEVCNAATGNS
ncbi:MAG: 4Fe-4S binding protein [Desulfobulbus sp.]|nr:4Fe-4S binding protein [Desulfobulbus sp.]